MAELRPLLAPPTPPPFEVADPLDEFIDATLEIEQRPKLAGLPLTPRDPR